MLRSHTCGQLRASNENDEVTLCGWVESYRDHGGTIFVDLRDRYGISQIVFAPEVKEILEQAKSLRNEDVIKVDGAVALRPAGNVNPKIDSGEIEVRATSLEILNKCKQPPFVPSQQELPGEDIRLRHRYLDLRRPAMQETMQLRSRIIKAMRDYFEEHDFVDYRNACARSQHAGRST